eukprot:gb/GECH01010924.1/.p1 GENE.gb/GECH01010924.1/~~gb/GECH01010924.1/.p1  ORF type:complete len:174 (+),score=18.37 gb/GECH01010924.1/:1-522(+)
MPERVIRFKEWFRFNGSYYLTPTRSSSIRFNYSKMVRYTATRCGHYIYMYGSRSGEQDGIQHLVRFDKKTYEWHLLNDLQPKEFAPPPTLKEYRLVTYGSDVILIGTTCSKTCQCKHLQSSGMGSLSLRSSSALSFLMDGLFLVRISAHELLRGDRRRTVCLHLWRFDAIAQQ